MGSNAFHLWPSSSTYERIRPAVPCCVGDGQSGGTQVWWEDRTYPGEPVFVATPGSSAEDDGVLLSVVLDARRSRSFLLVLDAATLAEIGRAECPHLIPFGFHGNYFQASGPHLSLDAIHR